MKGFTDHQARQLITVCDKCFRATCWQGMFMCEEAREAGIVKKSRRHLARLNLEHPCYWKTDNELLDESATEPRI